MRPLSLFLFLSILWAAPIQAQTSGLAAAAQPGTPAATEQPPALQPEPKLSDAEKERFLKVATITNRRKVDVGTTAPQRATLSDVTLTHDAQIQCVDVFKPVWKGAEGTTEKNFRDSWKFNVAAYKLARLLGIRNVPVSVERQIDGKLCSVTWWVDNVWLSEVDRREKGIKPPATDRWVNQLNAVRVFDQLIYNTDRNQGNLLITPEWELWLIDHTRAFRTHRELMTVEPLKRIDKDLLQALRKLNTVSLKRELGPWLRAEEISAILARRDLIVAFFEKEIQDKGEEGVLTGIPRSTPHVSLP